MMGVAMATDAFVCDPFEHPPASRIGRRDQPSLNLVKVGKLVDIARFPEVGRVDLV